MKCDDNFEEGKAAYIRGDEFSSCPFSFFNSGLSLEEYNSDISLNKNRNEWSKGYIFAKNNRLNVKKTP